MASGSDGQSSNPFQLNKSPFSTTPGFQNQFSANSQMLPVFGSTTATGQFNPSGQIGSSVSGGAFGGTLAPPAFSQASTTGQAAPAFGQASTGQFGTTSAFGQGSSTSQFGTFGQSSSGQFGSSSTFGQSSFGQISALGQTSIGQTGQTGTASIFGQASGNQFGTSSAFGPSSGAMTVFGQVSSSQPGSFASFDQSTPGVTGSTAFGQSSNDTTSSSQVKSTTVFGQPQQAASLFGSAFGKPDFLISSEQQAAPNNPFTFSRPATTTAILSNVSSVEVPSKKIVQNDKFLFKTSASTIASSAPFGATATNLAPSSSKPVFGSIFASASAVAKASPSKAEVSKESKPQSSSFQPQMLFGKPIAPSEQKMTDEQKFSDNPSAAAPRENVSRPGLRTLFGKAVRESMPAPKRNVEGGTADPSDTRENAVSSSSLKPAGDQSNRESTVSSTGSRRLIRRQASSDEVAESVSLSVRGIPAKHVTPLFLKKHFSKYGTVTKLYVNAKSNSAIVHFQDHRSAKRAKEQGQYLSPTEEPLKIFWRIDSSQRRLSGGDVSTEEVNPQTFESPSKKSQLDEELESMQGSSDISQERVLYVDRPPTTGGSSEQREPHKLKPAEVKDPADERPYTPPSTALDVNALRTLSDSVGITASDRFSLLEQKDKILKSGIGSQKHADLATAQAIKGSCPDMCPEKERYMREDRRRLSAYEIVPGTDIPGKNPQVDHARAVKEYSRSSADQDMPLPDELRPPEVLSMTMDYLLNNIMDTGGSGKWGDWYDFLWNRTRSIRKDITQQHLCDLVTVSLVEKSARFHIFCSEALCEEDAMTFDEKINNENLTKCLQTLKEMYHDLSVKQNIVCPNEAEFSAYMILMNLNQGDILREAQQWHVIVRESPAVKFSVAVHSALSSNNYVKFFKLVRQSTFLDACILHRYFNQIRSSALKRILRAYSPPGPGHIIYYPLWEMVYQLGFEDEKDATEFFSHYGLSASNGQLGLDKNRFYDPESAYTVKRSPGLVGGKQKTSLGEIVNGGPLPPNVIKDPHSSFDSQGRFIVASNLILDVQRQKPIAPATVSQPPENVPKHESPVVQQNICSNEVIKDLAKELFLEIIQEMCVGMSREIVDNYRNYLLSTQTISDQLLLFFTDTMTRELCGEAVQEIENVEKEKKKKMKEEFCVETSQNILEEILSETILQLSKVHGTEVYESITALVNGQSREYAIASIADNLISQIADHECRIISEEIYQHDVVERIKNMECALKKIQLKRVQYYFEQWRSHYKAQVRLKQSMQTFPPAPSFNSWSQQFTHLIPNSRGIVGDTLDLGCTVPLSLKAPHDIQSEREQLMEDILTKKESMRLEREKAWSPLDLVGMLSRTAAGNMPGDWPCKRIGSVLGSKLYWKLVIFHPCSENDSLKHWLSQKFQHGSHQSLSPDGKVQLIGLHSAPLPSSPVAGSVPKYSSVGICILSIDRSIDDEELEYERHLLGTSAIMFVLNNDMATAQQWHKERARLEMLLSAKPRRPSIPLLVVCSVCYSTHPRTVVDGLKLEMFVQGGLISEYRVHAIELNINNPATSDSLQCAVEWLMKSYKEPARIESKPVRDFCEDGLSKYYFTPIQQNLLERRKSGLLDLYPLELIDMYNDVVTWLSSVARDRRLTELSWPVREFCFEDRDLPPADWNLSEQLRFFEELVPSLVLPEFPLDKLDSDDWKTACSVVQSYVHRISDDSANCSEFFAKIQILLDNTEMRFNEFCCQSIHSRKKSFMPVAFNLPWTDIIAACIVFKLDQLSSCNHQSLVHYLPDMMDEYQGPSLHLETFVDNSKLDEVSLNDTILRSTKRKIEYSNVSDSFEPRIDKQARLNDVVDDGPTQNELAVNALAELVQDERKSSASFEEYLRTVLDAENQPPVYTFQTVSCLDPRGTSFSETKSKMSASRVFDSPMKSLPLLSPPRDYDLLNESLQSEKLANRLFELRLKRLIDN